MAPVPAPPIGLFAYALRETLEGLTSADRVAKIIATSLERAGLTEIPEDIDTFRRFVHGPLAGTMQKSLQPGATESCLERLGHVLWMASSVVRANAKTPSGVLAPPEPRSDEPSGLREVDEAARRLRDDAPTMPPPAPTEPTRSEASASGRRPVDAAWTPAARPMDPPSVHARRPMDPPSASASRPMDPPSVGGGRRSPTLGRIQPIAVRSPSVMEINAAPAAVRGPVLVLSLDASLVKEAEAALTGRREVIRVASRAELVNAIASLRATGFCVLVDTTLPTIELPVFAGLTSLLPPNTRVVLWGGDQRQKKRLVAVFPQASEWIVSGDATVVELFLGRTDTRE